MAGNLLNTSVSVRIGSFALPGHLVPAGAFVVSRSWMRGTAFEQLRGLYSSFSRPRVGKVEGFDKFGFTPESMRKSGWVAGRVQRDLKMLRDP